MEKEINYAQVIDNDSKNTTSSDYTLTTSADFDTVKLKLDDFHYHEMLDRLHVINCIINDNLLEHPVAFKHKRLSMKIEKALNLLSDAYQIAGNLNFKMKNSH